METTNLFCPRCHFSFCGPTDHVGGGEPTELHEVGRFSRFGILGWGSAHMPGRLRLGLASQECGSLLVCLGYVVLALN